MQTTVTQPAKHHVRSLRRVVPYPERRCSPPTMASFITSECSANACWVFLHEQLSWTLTNRFIDILMEVRHPITCNAESTASPRLFAGGGLGNGCGGAQGLDPLTFKSYTGAGGGWITDTSALPLSSIDGGPDADFNAGGEYTEDGGVDAVVLPIGMGGCHRRRRAVVSLPPSLRHE